MVDLSRPNGRFSRVIVPRRTITALMRPERFHVKTHAEDAVDTHTRGHMTGMLEQLGLRGPA